MLRVAVAVFVLNYVGPWAADQATAQQAETTPFTTGITDAASLTRVVDTRISRARMLLDSMLAVKGARTVANTLAPYDELLDELSTASGQVGIMAALHPDAATRDAADELDRAVNALLDEIPLRTDVYEALKAIDLRGADAPTRYYLARELRDFGRAGVDKPQATRAQLQQLRDQLTQAMTEFARNIREGTRQVADLTASDLEGLPADFIARHPASASGAITLTTRDVDARPVLMYATSGDLRRRMMVALYNVAAPENVAVLDRILRTRGEIAGLLGYRNWAAYDMQVRMAGD